MDCFRSFLNYQTIVARGNPPRCQLGEGIQHQPSEQCHRLPFLLLTGHGNIASLCKSHTSTPGPLDPQQYRHAMLLGIYLFQRRDISFKICVLSVGILKPTWQAVENLWMLPTYLCFCCFNFYKFITYMWALRAYGTPAPKRGRIQGLVQLIGFPRMSKNNESDLGDTEKTWKDIFCANCLI